VQKQVHASADLALTTSWGETGKGEQREIIESHRSSFASVN